MLTDIRFIINLPGEPASEFYRHLAEVGLTAPPQTYLWIQSWIEAVSPDVLSAVIMEKEQPVFALALEIIRKKGVRVAQFMGGSHANGNFAPADREWLERVDRAVLDRFFKAIGQARPDVDIIALERLSADYVGKSNPLLCLPHMKGPNVSLAVDLSGGFEEVLGRSVSKRKRKKHRAQGRKFEAAGGVQRIAASTPEQVNRFLDTFLEMKDVRFRKAGITNVFADRPVQDFFRRLFLASLVSSPKPFVLHGLEVGGKLRAITGSSIGEDRVICEFGGIVEDELSGQSPGEFLSFDNIQEACEQHAHIYDFSVGDEYYKRLWCDLETVPLDLLVPLTWKGRAFARGASIITTLKSRVKNNPYIWSVTKALRKRMAGGQTASRADAEQD